MMRRQHHQCWGQPCNRISGGPAPASATWSRTPSTVTSRCSTPGTSGTSASFTGGPRRLEPSTRRTRIATARSRRADSVTSLSPAIACRRTREHPRSLSSDEEIPMTDASPGRAVARDDRRTPAQWYCLLAGLALLLAGVFGFISDSSFDTGDRVQGDLFLGFEANAIHNLIHVASGLVLLAASRRRAPARAVALGFGLVYGLVAIIGLVDGEDVLDLF